MLDPEERAVLDTIARQVAEIQTAVGATADPNSPMGKVLAAMPKPGSSEHEALPDEVKAALQTIAAHEPGSYADTNL